MNATTRPPPQVTTGHRTLALVVGLLMLPFILGAGLYISGWQPTHPGNHGELLQPPLPVGPALPTAATGKWLLILAPDGPCDAACTNCLDAMRRIQVSLNKEMGRLRRLVVTPDPADPALAAAQNAQPDLLLTCHSAPWPDGGPALYVADPEGNLILRYGPTAAAKDIRTDLDRLLKFAWAG